MLQSGRISMRLKRQYRKISAFYSVWVMREMSRDRRSGKDHSAVAVWGPAALWQSLWPYIKEKDLHCGLSQLYGITADPGGRDVWGLGLQQFDFWNRRFESRWGNGRSSFVFVVCCVGRSLCNKLITRWRDCYCVCVCVCECACARA
jgi:hypothetical protein